MLSLRRWQTWALSLLFWTIYAVLDSAGSFVLIALSRESSGRGSVILWNFAEAYIWVLFTPLIYAITVRYNFSRQCWKKSLAVHVGMSLMIMTAVAFSLIKMISLLGWTESHAPLATRLVGLGLQDLPRYFVTVAVAQIVAYYGTLREKEAEAATLEARLAQAQLEILRSQMEPHFLFNALNSIAALTKKDPAGAEQMTLQLATLLRSSLDCAGAQQIPLKRELEFLQPYLEIQRTRFRDRLSIRVDMDENILSTAVPSLILQPLVENAIRHGIAKSALPGYIAITGQRQNGSVKIEIKNSGAGLAAGPQSQRESRGFGLRNTRERLRQLYGSRQELCIESDPAGGCRVILTIPAASFRCEMGG